MFKWFNNTPEAIYRKMGYYSDQSGIIRRYNREKLSWNEHLENTKEHILAYSKLKTKGKIAILGSGWLLDVPIDELSQMFTEVWLFDIRHSAEIKKQYSELNVFFVETDISGYAIEVYNLCKLKRYINQDDIEHLIPQFSFSLNEFDVVVSCNILDQLDDLLVEYLRGKAIINPEVEKKFRTSVQDAHIQLLPKNKSLIISDTKEMLLNSSNLIISEKELLFTTMNSLKNITKWVWKFDNSQMYHNAGNTWFTVEVFEK